MGDGIVLGPGEGEALRKPGGGRVAVVKAGIDDLTVLEFTIEGPFEGPSPHTHDDQTDSFYVLEGSMEFFVEGEWLAGGPGTFVAAPRGVAHAFRKTDAGTCRFLNVHAPGGFERDLRQDSE
jgi:quercetin dioxygenase-like cupin family protein